MRLWPDHMVPGRCSGAARRRGTVARLTQGSANVTRQAVVTADSAFLRGLCSHPALPIDRGGLLSKRRHVPDGD